MAFVNNGWIWVVLFALLQLVTETAAKHGKGSRSGGKKMSADGGIIFWCVVGVLLVGTGVWFILYKCGVFKSLRTCERCYNCCCQCCRDCCCQPEKVAPEDNAPEVVTVTAEMMGGPPPYSEKKDMYKTDYSQFNATSVKY